MTSTEHGSSRRAVLKGAAWTAPAIVVATAAPAMAASLQSVLAFVPPTTATRNAVTNVLSVNSNLANAGAPTVGLKFTVTLTPTSGNLNGATAEPLAGYTITDGATSANGRQFVYTATTQLGTLGTRNFAPTFSNVGRPGTVSIQATSNNGGNATTQSTFA